MLEIACWNGEYIQLGFVLDCHDRECLAWTAPRRDLVARDIQQLMHDAVAQRFVVWQRPDAPIQFLSDNGSIYSALDSICTAERLNLEPITTPKASPQSNGMSEAFVNTLKRDYVSGADRGDADVLFDQAGRWIEDYNAIAPHSALGYRSPWQYRSEVLELVQRVSPSCRTNRGSQQDCSHLNDNLCSGNNETRGCRPRCAGPITLFPRPWDARSASRGRRWCARRPS